MNFQKFFTTAMDRPLPALRGLPVQERTILNLGAGNKVIPDSIPLDLPEWDADRDLIPYPDESIEVIWALHFLEHCSNPVAVLQEIQRVLVPGGFVNICVPYYSAAIASQDLDHKHFFTEETWKTLLRNNYYDKNRIHWKLNIGFNLICGIVERNMVLLTQLIKRNKYGS